MRICHLTPLARRGPWTTPEYGCGSWCLALGAEFFPYAADDLTPLEGYDLLLLHTAMGLYPRVLEVLERFAHKPAVLLLTCDAMFIDPQGFFPGFALPLKALLDRARLAVTETEEVGFFQAMTSTPVVHLPLPVPLEAMRSCSAQSGIWNLESGISILLGSGFRAKKNGLATALAFRRLRSLWAGPPGLGDPCAGNGGTVALSRESATVRPLPAAHPAGPCPAALVFAEEPEAEREAFRLWGIEGVEVRPTCPQPDYWRRAAACGLALHLDYRRTIGRFSAECAALGVPCISTAGATMQRACFPDLIVEPWDVEGAATLAQRLLRDPTFRDRVLDRAAGALEPFDLAPSAARFRQALARFVG
ncbi:MAG TPA: hypothetical protein VNE39_28095 [Planctomycetota bacterium]|nr:hypothetical protein [Planctomycetota bacterium]